MDNRCQQSNICGEGDYLPASVPKRRNASAHPPFGEIAVTAGWVSSKGAQFRRKILSVNLQPVEKRKHHQTATAMPNPPARRILFDLHLRERLPDSGRGYHPTMSQPRQTKAKFQQFSSAKFQAVYLWSAYVCALCLTENSSTSSGTLFRSLIDLKHVQTSRP